MDRLQICAVGYVLAAAACGSPRHSLEGRVRLSDGAPLAGASVILQTGEATVSDRQGLFSFANLEAGELALSVSALWTIPRRQVRVVVLPSYGPLELAFNAAGRIEGEVRVLLEGPQGRLEVSASEGVEVQLSDPPGRASTDEEGHFIFDRVPVGQRQLAAVGVGLVTASATSALVEHGRSTRVSLLLVPGRAFEQDANSAPVIEAPIAVKATAADGNPTRLTPPKAAGTLVRGEQAELTCLAEDPDDDPLSYIWAASSGSLVAGSGPSAAITAGAESIGVTCSVVDGRGGFDSSHAVIDVIDPYYAGATLAPGGAVFASTTGQDVDLVVWTDRGATRLPMAELQWLPQTSGKSLAYVETSPGRQALMLAQVSWATTPPILTASPLHVASSPAAFAVTESGVVWVDKSGVARLRRHDGSEVELARGVGPNLASHGEVVGLAVGGANIDVIDLRDLEVTRIPAPGLAQGDFATDGTRVAYWAQGRPVLSTESGMSVVLGPETIDGDGDGDGSGRIALGENWAAYSYYDSPLQFLEATVVRLYGDRLGERGRLTNGPAEVLDLDGNRLLVGKPRAIESEPSAELWIWHLDLLELHP